MLSRRTFIAGSTAAVAYMGIGTMPAVRLRHDLRRADFEGLRDRSFRVSDARGKSFRCTLEALKEGPRAPGLDQFTLVFERGDGRELEQGLYELWNPELQRFPLHLDPTGGLGSSRFIAYFGQYI